MPGNDQEDAVNNLRVKVKSVNQYLLLSGGEKQSQLLKVKDEQIESLNKQLGYITELMLAKEMRDRKNYVNVSNTDDQSTKKGFQDLKKIIDWAVTEEAQNGPNEGISPLSIKKFEIMISEVNQLVDLLQPSVSKSNLKSMSFYTKPPRQTSFTKQSSKSQRQILGEQIDLMHSLKQKHF